MIGLIAAQYHVDHILEYLRAMATHQCSPVLISPPALRKLLRKVKDRITPNPRLKLPYHISLGGFMWAISAVITEKLQVRCLTETHVVDIRPPVEIVYIGNGCEGYSPHLFILARSTLTSEINIFEREQYFLKFNVKYRIDSKIGIWAKLKFRLQSKEEARKEVHKWAELHHDYGIFRTEIRLDRY